MGKQNILVTCRNLEHSCIRKIESAGKTSGSAAKLFTVFTLRLALQKNILLELMRTLSFWDWKPYRKGPALARGAAAGGVLSRAQGVHTE